MKRKVFLMIAAALIAASGLFAGGNQSSRGGVANLTLAIRQHPDDILDTSQPYWKWLENKFNMKLNLIPIDTDEKLNVLLASGEVYDWIVVNSAIANLYGAEGVFDNVGDLLKQYPPTERLKDLLDPGVAYSFRDDNGKLYFIPRYIQNRDKVGDLWFYRPDLLKGAGVGKEPENMDEWYQAFKAVKAKYPAISPANFGNFGTNFYGPLMTYWDMAKIGGGGNFYGLIGSQRSNNKVVFFPATENFKQEIAYLKKLNDEKLLDPEWPTATWEQWQSQATDGSAFSLFSGSYRLGLYNMTAPQAGHPEVVYAAPVTPRNSAGNRELFYSTSQWNNEGPAIYAKSKNKAVLMKMLDYFYTKEGATEWMFGLEGVTYDRVNGVIEPRIANANDRQIARTKLGYNDPWPTMWLTEINERDLTPAQRFLVDDARKYSVYIPEIKYSSRDAAELGQIVSNMDTYMSTLVSELILGRKSMNDWNTYLADLEKIGSQRGAELIQKAWDEYQKTAK